MVFRGCAPGQSNIPQTGDQQEGSLGQAFTAAQVDQNGCPIDNTNQFGSSETIYVGFTQSEIPSGTSIFARLNYEGQPVEDTDEITADQDLRSCVWFEFQPTQGGFQPGNYTAELFINGNPADELRLSVSQDSAGAASGGLAGVQLGRLWTTSSVDNDGCPNDFVDTFGPDEPVYLAYEQSRIPAGTEIFARLLYDGQTIEDTQPIRADQEMTTCFWFVFEPEAGAPGLDPGPYEAEVYVNGQLADQIRFDVR
jgi:hypothetical protein